jgi:hypothetical protein
LTIYSTLVVQDKEMYEMQKQLLGYLEPREKTDIYFSNKKCGILSMY